MNNVILSDNTFNTVKPYIIPEKIIKANNPNKIKQETKKHQQYKQQTRVTPIKQRQTVISSYKPKTVVDKAAERQYAAKQYRDKEEEDRKSLGTGLLGLVKSVQPSSLYDMYREAKNGGNIVDVLSAPYLTDSWSNKNQGKAFAIDMGTFFGLGTLSKGASYIKNINSVIPKTTQTTKRSHPLMPARSHPLVDPLRLQWPTWDSGSLGFGHKYRAIGRNKGLKDAMENGIRSKAKAYNDVNEVYWAQDEPLREYTKSSPLLLRYDKSGKAVFRTGNDLNPVSSAENPISFWDDNVTLHGRWPFYSRYHQIPKTEEGIKHAKVLNNLNRFVETPVRKGTWGYLYYKLFDSLFNTKNDEEETN